MTVPLKNPEIPKPAEVLPPSFRPRIVTVRLATLGVDYTYQRTKKPHWRKIATDWNPKICEPLTVGERPDGTRWIINGQQRCYAMQHLKITHWNANVIETTGPKHEADLFTTLNGGKGSMKNMAGRDLFKAQLVAENPLAVTTLEAVRAVPGFDINYSSAHRSWQNLTCIKTLLSVVHSYGGSNLTEALRLIGDVWTGHEEAMADYVVAAVSRLLNTHGDKLLQPRERVKVVKRLTSKIPVQFLTSSLGRSNEGGRHRGPYNLIVSKLNWRKPPEEWLPELTRTETEIGAPSQIRLLRRD